MRKLEGNFNCVKRREVSRAVRVLLGFFRLKCVMGGDTNTL